MSEMGKAMMGSGAASGQTVLKKLLKRDCQPLLEDIDLSGARGILVNITAGQISPSTSLRLLVTPLKRLPQRMPQWLWVQ